MKDFRYIGTEIGGAVSALAGAYTFTKLRQVYQFDAPNVKEMLMILPGQVLLGATGGYIIGGFLDILFKLDLVPKRQKGSNLSSLVKNAQKVARETAEKRQYL